MGLETSIDSDGYQARIGRESYILKINRIQTKIDPEPHASPQWVTAAVAAW